MKVLGIIPARGGSKRIPGKNKKDFCGKPLINYIIEAAKNAELLDAIVVNSDDEDIINIAKLHSGIIAMTRPEEISQDHTKAIEYVHQTPARVKNKRATVRYYRHFAAYFSTYLSI